MSAILGIALFFCMVPGRAGRTAARGAVAAGGAAIPVALVTLGVLFVNEPFRHDAPGSQAAGVVGGVLALAQLILLPTAFVLSAARAGSGVGTMLACLFTLAGLGAETFVAVLAGGQMLAGVSL